LPGPFARRPSRQQDKLLDFSGGLGNRLELFSPPLFILFLSPLLDFPGLFGLLLLPLPDPLNVLEGPRMPRLF
jgi:hypothetical protein